MKDSFGGAGEVVALLLCALNTIFVLAYLGKIWFGDRIADRLRRS
jgi:hypothetical protein